MATHLQNILYKICSIENQHNTKLCYTDRKATLGAQLSAGLSVRLCGDPRRE